MQNNQISRGADVKKIDKNTGRQQMLHNFSLNHQHKGPMLARKILQQNLNIIVLPKMGNQSSQNQYSTSPSLLICGSWLCFFADFCWIYFYYCRRFLQIFWSCADKMPTFLSYTFFCCSIKCRLFPIFFSILWWNLYHFCR